MHVQCSSHSIHLLCLLWPAFTEGKGSVFPCKAGGGLYIGVLCVQVSEMLANTGFLVLPVCVWAEVMGWVTHDSDAQPQQVDKYHTKVMTERCVCLCCSLLHPIEQHQKQEGSAVTVGNGPELVLFIFKLLNSDDIVNSLCLQHSLEGPMRFQTHSYATMWSQGVTCSLHSQLISEK